MKLTLNLEGLMVLFRETKEFDNNNAIQLDVFNLGGSGFEKSIELYDSKKVYIQFSRSNSDNWSYDHCIG